MNLLADEKYPSNKYLLLQFYLINHFSFEKSTVASNEIGIQYLQKFLYVQYAIVIMTIYEHLCLENNKKLNILKCLLLTSIFLSPWSLI